MAIRGILTKSRNGYSHYSYFDACSSEFGRHAGRNGRVGNDTIQVFGPGDEGIATFVELGGIEDRDNLTCLLDHELVHERFLQAGRGDTVLHGERIDAEEEFVAREIAEDGESERSDGRMVVGMDVAAQENHVETVVGDEFGSDIDGVGEDMQVAELMQMARHLKRSRAGVEHDMIALFDEFDRLFADTLFLFEIEHPFARDSRFSVGVLHRPTHSASARADKQIAVLQNGQVLSDSDFGDACFAA